MVTRAVVNKILVVTLHVCGWALLFMLPFHFLSSPGFTRQPMPRPDMPERMMPGPGPFSQMDPTWFKVESVLVNLMLATFFYTNMFVLVPKVLTRRGWAPYVLLVVVSLGLYITAGYLFRLNVTHAGNPFRPPIFMGVPNFFMVFGLSLALRIMQDRAAFESTRKEQETEKLKSELLFLRSQVSPHFMFNVLNGLASLARKKSDQVEFAIIQFSQLMRYSLYHSDKKVTLDQEADYIGNYINLQKLRFGTTVNIHFHVNMERKDLLIEPMLLIPFVENAFKHGVGLIKDPVIMVILESTEHQVHFVVRNKFNPRDNETKDPSSGIGLQNVRRRLDLLYTDLYTLDVYASDDDWFISELKLIAS